MASFRLNETLNKYFADDVQLAAETTRAVVHDVMPDIDKLLQTIHRLEPHYEQQPIGVGSYYQGLKVSKANEFDFSIPFHIGTKLVWSERRSSLRYGFNCPDQNDENTTRDDLRVVSASSPLTRPGVGYLTVRLSDNQRFSENLGEFIFDGDLIPFLVKRKFRQKLFEVLSNNRRLQDDVKLNRIIHGPALTLRLEVEHKSSTRPITVSVDFAVIIRAELSFAKFIGWPRPDSRWPSNDKIAIIRKKGINLVAKKNFFWYLSFAEVEKELVHDIDRDGGCRKKVHRIMKRLLEQYNGEKKELSTYMIKNAWLWECEDNPLPDFWAQIRLGERFIGCIGRLDRFIQEGRLPQYFYPNINLFKGKDVYKLRQILYGYWQYASAKFGVSL